MTKAVGGEFYFNEEDQNHDYGTLDTFLHRKNAFKYHGYFLGGSYAIKWILRDLKKRKKGFTLLLPSYLCQSIITAVQSEKVDFSFYEVDQHLNIDIDSLEQQVSASNSVLYLINYFGFGQNQETLDFIRKVKTLYGTAVIEDDVQSCFSQKETFGDYVFNSFKKWHAVDGSIVFAHTEVPQTGLYNDEYLSNRKAVRDYRFLQQEKQLPYEEKYLEAVESANKSYLKPELYGMHANDKQRLNQINLEAQSNTRKDNFTSLLQLFAQISFFKELPEGIVPFTFPVLLQNRNEKRQELFKEQIFCPIHWHTPALLKNKFKKSKDLSDMILSIPINKTLTSHTIGKLKKILTP